MSWTLYKPYHTLTIYKHCQYWIQIPSFAVQFPSAFAFTSCYLQRSSEDCPWTIVRVCAHTHRHTHTPMQRARGAHPLLLPLPLPWSPQPVADCYRIMKTQFPCFRRRQTWGQKLGMLSRIRLKLGLFLNCLLTWFHSLCFLPSLTGFSWVHLINKSFAHISLSQGLILPNDIDIYVCHLFFFLEYISILNTIQEHKMHAIKERRNVCIYMYTHTIE